MAAVRLMAFVLLSLVPLLAAAQTVVVSGSSTVYPLMTEIARRFEGLNPGVSIEVRSGGSGKGVAGLLTGRISDWSQLGAPAGAINLAWRAEGQAIPELIQQHLKLRRQQIRRRATIFENADAVGFVAKDRNAITVAALGVAERSFKSGAPIKLLAYQGVPASTRAVRDHTYLLSRPLTLVTRSTPTGLQKRLIEYASSGAVTDLQEKHGFVPYND